MRKKYLQNHISVLEATDRYWWRAYKEQLAQCKKQDKIIANLRGQIGKLEDQLRKATSKDYTVYAEVGYEEEAITVYKRFPADGDYEDPNSIWIYPNGRPTSETAAKLFAKRLAARGEGAEPAIMSHMDEERVVAPWEARNITITCE